MWDSESVQLIFVRLAFLLALAITATHQEAKQSRTLS